MWEILCLGLRLFSRSIFLKRRALLLVNRRSRRGRRLLRPAIAQLEAAGLELVQPLLSRHSDYSDVIVAHRDRVDLVIVGGGDGSLNAAARGLVETQLPLGVLPLGTANDLARTLALPTDLNQACQVIAQGQTQAIDLGWVNGYYYFNVASLGLSVKITQGLTSGVKRRWGVLAYALVALRSLWRFRPFRAEIRVGDRVRQTKTVQIAVGNGRYYGGGLAIAHDAAIDDQRLDLYSLSIDHWWQIIPLLPALYHGRYPTPLTEQCGPGETIEIRTRRHRHINTDGEIHTTTPARFRVIPQALRIFVPATVTGSPPAP
ncbi:lipid kinase [Synechococcus elongatus]|uniref:Lipid kinase n=1 Tax=Synechococcus elongatus PCC 11802 TaxID=2283154 RepID=A0AAU6R5A7_SYNEL